MADSKHRFCKICGIEKPLSAFERWRRQCKKCRVKKYKYSHKKHYCRTYFGLTPEEYDKTYSELFKEQNGKCYLCKKSDAVLRLDHSHSTGKIRKLLCVRCNLFTGYVEKNLDFVSRIIRYIEKF